MVHHFSSIVMIPVMIKDASLFEKVAVCLGMRKRSEYGEFRKVEVDLEQKIDQPLDIVFRLVIETEQDGSFHSDPIFMVLLDPVADVIRLVEHSLVNIPCTGLSSEFQHFILIFNRVTYPFFLQGDHCPEKVF